MGYKAKKTEHSGAKKGHGSYWGRKTDAKKESNRKRREDNKELIREHGPILAHALEKPVILITKDISVVPFGVAGFNHIVYKNISDLEQKLTARLKALIGVDGGPTRRSSG